MILLNNSESRRWQVSYQAFSLGCYSETGFHIGMDRNFVCLWRRHNWNWSLPFCADFLIWNQLLGYKQLMFDSDIPCPKLVCGLRSSPAVARFHCTPPASSLAPDGRLPPSAADHLAGRDSYWMSADSGLDDAFVERLATRSPPLVQLVLAKTLHVACSPQFCHRRPSPPVVTSLGTQLGNHAPWPTPPLVCGGEVNCWPPERSGAARSTSAQPTAVSPLSFR